MPSAKHPSLTPDQLTQVRQNTNWRQLFDALHIAKDTKKSKDHDWWGKSPFRPDEITASFHMNTRGWYCHSTRQGGGAIELVQRLHTGMHCYGAGRWLLERRISRITSSIRAEIAQDTAGTGSTGEPAEAEESALVNPPIRQDQLPSLVAKHEIFDRRGIPPQILYDLGAGYLERASRKDGRHDPMNRRLVFQIRRLADDPKARPASYIVGHIGRATTAEQEERDGKWWTYAGFHNGLEVYNLHHVYFDEEAEKQALLTGHVLVVEGCFDVAKLYAAGIRNVIATFGAQLSEPQLAEIQRLTFKLGVNRLRFFFDRKDAGARATGSAIELVDQAGRGLQADAFDWSRTWTSGDRKEVPIPDSIADSANFSPGQLRWLRQEGLL